MRTEKAFLKKRKDFIQWCIIAGIIISLFICLIDNTMKMNKGVEKETKGYVADIVKQMSREISYRMQSYERYISETADSFSKMPDRILTESVLEKKKNPLLFENLIIVDTEGKTFPENFQCEVFAEYVK